MSGAADESAPARPERRARRGLWVASIAAVAAGCIAVAGWQILGADAGEQPVLDVPADDVVGLVDLATIHLNSNLRYDRCQMDYAQISSDPSSSRNPLYFC